MAFEFDFNATFKWCALYLSKGLRIIRLHGFRPDGYCTCGNPECGPGGSMARNAGKHPRASNWGSQFAKTEDDILAWDDGVPFNVGVVLGPGGGYIDCEDDSPEGRAFRESLGLAEYETPSWTSGRSTHQLTAWDDRLEGISKAEPGGLECRVGGGGSQMQSVLPPSWHHSGVQYQWKAGLSIDEVDIAPTPKQLIAQIVNYSSAGAGGGSGGAAYKGPLVFREVADGEGRHRSLLLWTWDKIVSNRDPLDSRQRAIITKEIQDDNEKYIKPPKSSKEVLAVVNSCFEHYRRKRESGWAVTSNDLTEEAVTAEAAEAGRVVAGGSSQASVAVGGFEGHGLERWRVGDIDAYRPGDWKIQMIQGDPPEVVLIVPAWSNTPCRGRVHMTFDTFRSAAKVASTVFLATRRVILDGDSGRWVQVWKGIDASKKSGGKSVPGLMEQLVQRKAEEDDILVGTSSLRYAQLAGYVLQVLARATYAKEDAPAPNQSGRPCWVTPDECWLQWAKVWEDIGRSHDVVAGERNRIRARLLEMVPGNSDFVHKRHRFPSGGRMEYVVFTRPWIDALERMAAGEDAVVRPVKGEIDSLFSKSENHSPSTVQEHLSPMKSTG